MKNMKKGVVMLLMLLLVSTMLMGCKPKIGPDESAKVISDFMVKGDRTKISQIIKDKKELDKYDKKEKDTFVKELKDSSSSGDLQITDAQCDEVYDSVRAALKKVTVTTKKVSEDKDSATVTVTTTYVDMASVVKQAVTESIQEVMAEGLTDETQAKNEAVKAYIKNVAKDMKEIKPSTKTVSNNFKFKVQSNVWVPEDEDAFETKLGEMVLGE
ncbi:membrane protein [Clostridium acetobutylicum]|nr:membrane protein [Clostridium acetobutylicum]